MKITVLMDSFKGSLTSREAGEAVKAGIEASRADVSVFPFADGGEGTLDAFLAADKGSRRVTIPVSDPIGRVIRGCYGILSDDTVVIETAQSAGLNLLSEDERDPMHTTTKGVGQFLRHAIDRGYRRFIIALGGSATNDCGLGMLKELGLVVSDAEGEPVGDGAAGLSKAVSIDDSKLLPQIKECEITLACDVENPLCGPNGASCVFAPQKGAAPEDVEKMDEWMRHFSEVVKKLYTHADADAEGAGAAGGLGYAFRTFFNAKMQPGAVILIERTDIESRIAESDLVITGEGRMDAQTAMGKAPARIAQLAKRYGKHVIAIAGCAGDGYEKCKEAGIDEIYFATPDDMELSKAMNRDTAVANIKSTVWEVMRKNGVEQHY
ncbi:MAG: glycerate kinase [Lachnospiraceae bacterium]|nr:glycerate kinase [Lachnospiraceae bacterium]